MHDIQLPSQCSMVLVMMEGSISVHGANGGKGGGRGGGGGGDGGGGRGNIPGKKGGDGGAQGPSPYGAHDCWQMVLIFHS